MGSPFPGMDPWLERRGIWEQVHTGLIVSMQRFLTPLLRPRYHVGIEERTYLAIPMPEEVRERYLEIRTVPDRQVVTVIEILSPSNKLPGDGRAQYESKRLKVLGSGTNLVEIDLVRAGQPLPMKAPAAGDYRIVVSRSARRPSADVYLFSVRDPIPTVPVPLGPGEPEPELPLNQLLHEVYDLGGYDLAIDYRNPPQPALSDSDAAWAASLLPSPS